MGKEVMRRQAADNEYLHKDFHGALSGGIQYLHGRFGPDAVREYLYDFARGFYAPLTAAIEKRGLVALKEHIEQLYETEGGTVDIELTDDGMLVTVETCPAVMHMREKGYPVAELFVETTKTVNEALCEGTGFAAELVEYDPETGRSVQRFFRSGK